MRRSHDACDLATIDSGVRPLPASAFSASTRSFFGFIDVERQKLTVHCADDTSFALELDLSKFASERDRARRSSFSPREGEFRLVRL